MAICSFADQLSHMAGSAPGPAEFAELRTEAGCSAWLLEISSTTGFSGSANYSLARATVTSIPTTLGTKRFVWESDEQDRLCPVLLIKAFETTGLIRTGYSRNPSAARNASGSIIDIHRRVQSSGWVWTFPRGIKFSATSTLVLDTGNSTGAAPDYYFVAETV